MNPTSTGTDFQLLGNNGNIRFDSRAGSNSYINTGNVGIGTTSPAKKLEVNGTVHLGSGGNDVTIGASNSSVIYMMRAGYNYIQASDASGAIMFRTGGANNRMIIDSSGNVGIGTTSPSQKLQVVSDSIVIADFTTTSTKGGIKIAEADEGGFLSTEANRICLGSAIGVSASNLTYHMGTNSLGIGTASPNAKLTLRGSGLISQDFFHIEDSGGVRMLEVTSDPAGNANLQVKDTTGVTKSLINSAGNSYFNGGNIGIGTTSPGQKLEVAGQVLSDGYRLAAMQTAPATRNSTGTLGEIVIDGNHIYVCYATDSWSRVALDTSW